MIRERPMAYPDHQFTENIKEDSQKGRVAKPSCSPQQRPRTESGWTTCPVHCTWPHTVTPCPAPAPDSPDLSVPGWYCNNTKITEKNTNYIPKPPLTSTRTHLSRMQDTSKLSTSAGSIFSSLEMNVIAIRVYGLISFTRTCVRMFRRRSEGI